MTAYAQLERSKKYRTLRNRLGWLWRSLREDLKLFGLFGTISYRFTKWHPIYWLRCHTLDRYNLIDAGSKHNPAGYRWGWCDVDHLMLYANFELLRRFIVDEKGLESLEYQGPAFRRDAEKSTWMDDEQKKRALDDAANRDAIYNEVRYLWHWWTKERDSDQSDDDYEKDTEMLIRLMKVRGSLWT